MKVTDLGKVVRVGVSVLVWNYDGQLLMGKRKGSHGAGTWAFPGGHIEWGESPTVTADRELAEELGHSCKFKDLDIFQPLPYTSTVYPSGEHYVTLFFEAELLSGVPETMEPDKCESWEWFHRRHLPNPLFYPMLDLLKNGVLR